MQDAVEKKDLEDAGFLEFQEKIRGSNINAQTLLATVYLNHFNEIVMVLEMVPDFPDFLDDAKEWLPKSYVKHFQDSAFSDKDLAVAAYAHVPERFIQPFEQTIDQINRLMAITIQRLEEVIDEDNPEKLRFVTADSSKSIRRLIDFASGIIHGSQNTMDQSDIDLLLEN